MAPLAPDVYHLGPHTLGVPRGLLHGFLRETFLHKFRSRSGLAIEDQGVVLLQGGKNFHLHNTDMELLFRQEGFFHYLFGVTDEDFYGALDIRTGRSFLFMPRLPESYAVWMGAIATPEAVRAKYAVDEVGYVDTMAATLKELDPPFLHTLDAFVNTDSGRRLDPVAFPGLEQFRVDGATAWPVLAECRVHKSAEEIEIMRYTARITSAAHVEAMRAAAPGQMEYQLEAQYLGNIYKNGGCRTGHYTPIFASGPNSCILHYGHAGAPNDRQMEEGDLILVDAGAEYYRYAADITTTFPVGGKFSADQALVYRSVLAANRAVLGAMRPGVQWGDMHVLAERTLLEGLTQGGLLSGDVDAMVEARLGAVFMPHGLGHFLGIDTHDVGGYLPGLPERSPLPGLCRLRTNRVLEEGMVITVEPGCYFNAALLGPALQDPALAPFLVADRIAACMGMGGVRIEDDVIVTAVGAETMVHVPRTVEEIEAVMAGAPWPPQHEAAS